MRIYKMNYDKSLDLFMCFSTTTTTTTAAKFSEALLRDWASLAWCDSLPQRQRLWDSGEPVLCSAYAHTDNNNLLMHSTHICCCTVYTCTRACLLRSVRSSKNCDINREKTKQSQDSHSLLFYYILWVFHSYILTPSEMMVMCIKDFYY